MYDIADAAGTGKGSENQGERLHRPSPIMTSGSGDPLAPVIETVTTIDRRQV